MVICEFRGKSGEVCTFNRKIAAQKLIVLQGDCGEWKTRMTCAEGEWMK